MRHDVIKKVLAGDTDAYAAVVREHQEMLTAFASFRLPGRDLVDEAVQQTFIRAYTQLDQYDPDRDLATWLRAICTAFVKTELTRARREAARNKTHHTNIRRMMLDRALEEESLADPDAIGRLRECMRKLSDSMLLLIRSRYDDAMAVSDIAAAVGRSVTWVTTTLARVRRSLRTCIQGLAADEVR